MTVLGVDPGLASTGWGVVQSSGSSLRFVAQGTIRTVSDESAPERLLRIHRALTDVIGRFKPDEMAVETLYFARNISSAIPVAQARGVVLVTAAQAGIPCRELAPNEIKQAVVGVGNAGKEQVGAMVSLLLGFRPEPATDHAMDALASAICCIHRGGAIV